MAESVLLQSCFHLLPSEKLYEVRLTRLKLIYQQTSIDSCFKTTNPILAINLEDIYGVKVYRHKQRNDYNPQLHIFACPVQRKKRILKVIRFKVSGWDDLDANIKSAERWLKMILWLVKDPLIQVNDLQDRRLPAKRKLLVLVNPFSGSGKSLNIFYTQVAPKFTLADIQYNLIVTEHAGHAEKIAMEVNINEWDGLVICSGDGLVHEVINGLMKRKDWPTAIKLPLGVIPTGSGNALCYSALHASREPFDVTTAIFAVIRGKTHELDLCTIETPNKKVFSFLSLSWGMISDVDIESEKYRCLGNARFTVGAVIRILNLRTYRGRLSYLPPDAPHEMLHSPGGVLSRESNRREMGSQRKENNTINSSFEEKNFKTIELGHENEVIKSSQKSFNNIAHSRLPDITECLPSLSAGLPPNWITIEGEFVLGSSVLLSHLDGNCNFVPEAKFGDGFLYLVYIKAGVSKSRLFGIFSEMETGEQADSDDFVIIKARAFRLEPDLTQVGTMAVDGERISYSTVQGEVHKGMARVFCSRPYNS